MASLMHACLHCCQTLDSIDNQGIEDCGMHQQVLQFQALSISDDGRETAQLISLINLLL